MKRPSVTFEQKGKEMARSRRDTGDEAIASTTSGTSSEIASSRFSMPLTFRYRRLGGDAISRMGLRFHAHSPSRGRQRV